MTILLYRSREGRAIFNLELFLEEALIRRMILSIEAPTARHQNKELLRLESHLRLHGRLRT